MDLKTLVLFGAWTLIGARMPVAAQSAPDLSALKTAYDEKVKVEVQQPYEALVVDLNVKYASALDRALAAAQNAGKLDDALALTAEKEAVATGKGVPAADDDKPQAFLKPLRETYRTALARLAAERDKKEQPMRAALLAVFDAEVTRLTKLGQLKEALAVKIERDTIATVVGPLSAVVAKPAPPPAGAPPATSQSPTYVNSLGMKFVLVPGTKIMMCIHETRRSDYAAFASNTPGLDRTWQRTVIHKTVCGGEDDHPAVSIGYDQAVAFCAWLSQKDKRTFRLPTDREWSSAVGIAQDESWNSDATPAKRSGGVPNRFPWEGDFPPKAPEKDGNYWDLTAKDAFTGYESFDRLVVPNDNNDCFPSTAPVMSFKSNKFGIYDLGGNAVEWVEEWFDDAKKYRTHRGGGWFSDKSMEMESSYRKAREPDRLGAHVGFRCVVETP